MRKTRPQHGDERTGKRPIDLAVAWRDLSALAKERDQAGAFYSEWGK